MAFFAHPVFNNNTEASFTPLFRLLDDFDKYSRQDAKSTTSHNNNNSNKTTTKNGRRSPVFHWQPKFDVRETADAYELHGELPGLDKENVSIEFPDPQNLIVRGKVERSYSSGSPPAGQLESSTEKPTIAEGGSTSSRRSSYQATVEDEQEAEAKASGEVVEQPSEQQPKEQPAGDKAKYWLTERSIGEFSRSFTFPSVVNQDAVTASLKDGILSVTVPKAKHESRRIAIL